MRRGLLACVIGLAGLWLGPAHAAQPALPQQLQSVVDSYLQSRRVPEKISGVALHVDVAGHPPVDVYAGNSGRKDTRPIDGRTLFQIGSNTKHFTAALVLKLEAEGKLNIDQTVGYWLPQYKDWANVKIRSLLNMTSDIPTYSEAVPIAETLAADMHHQFDYDTLIGAAYGKGLPVPTGYFYSNTNNILAAKIIEAAGHRSFPEALADMIRPLHLANTFYQQGPYPAAVLQRLPVGIYDNHDCTMYQPKPCTKTAWAPLIGVDVSDMNMSWAGPAGGIISNMQDLSQWVRALFAGRVIPQKQLAEMTSMVSLKTGKPIADVSPEDPMGFGLDLGRGYREALGGRYWYYQGTTFGFRAVFAYWPQYDLVITTTTNSQPEDHEDKLAETVIGGAFQALRADGLIH